MGADTNPKFLSETSALVREIYAYWNDLRGDRVMPMRSELDPSAIPSHLPGLLLIKFEGLDETGTGIYRYRIVGETEIRSRGHNPTGKLVQEGYLYSSLDAALEEYDWVRRNKTYHYALLDFVVDQHRPIREYSIVLPFADKDGEVEYLLVFSDKIEQG